MALAIAMVAAPLPAAAGPASQPAAGDPKSDVGAMWREANAKLATSDYPGAITLLTRIYETIATDPDARMLRLRVRWALHEAHLGAYGLDDDPKHLYVARDVLKNGMADFGPDEGALRAKSEVALTNLDARIGAIEAAQRERAAAEQKRLADEQAAEAERRRQAESEQRVQKDQPPPPRPVEPATPPVRRGLLIGGVVSAGIGVIGLAVLAGGFGTASQAVHTFETEPGSRMGARRGIARGNAIGIVGAVIAAAGITTAAILLPLALRRPKQSTRGTAFRWTGSGFAWK